MIRQWSQGEADEGMPEALLVEVFRAVHQHPWWHARSAIALAILRQQGVLPPARIVDAGCGWGTNLISLEQAGYQTVGIDISRQVLELLDRPGRELVQADLTQDLPAEGALAADALLSLDVIEHIDDDRGAVRRMAGMVRPGGLGVFSVPALPELFSEFDAIQGHRRRYLPDTLRSAFEGTGWRVLSIFWWGRWMVPILRRRRKTSANPTASSAEIYRDHLRLPPWPGPLVMQWAYRWEHSRALSERLQTGTSLFAVARRED